MRVWHVHVSSRLAPVNGVVQSIHRLAAAQRAAGLDALVFHGTPTDPRGEPTHGHPAELARELRRARALTGPPDVLHLHEPFHPPHLVARALLRSVPVVVTLHGALAPASRRRSRLAKAAYGLALERAAIGRAAGVIAHSASEAADTERYARRRRPTITLVPNATDPALLADTGWSGGDGSGRLVCLSRWDVRHKGLDRVAALAAHLPETDVRLHGSRCGNEPEQLELLMATAPPNVTFATSVSGPAKRDALVGADAFILLSRWEGQAMALVEALSLGVPCLVSPEVAATVEAPGAMAVLPADPARAAATVRRLLADRGALAEQGRRGRAWARRTADPTPVAARTVEIYDGAIAGGRATGDRRVRP